ncbi:MAG: hypothetical protein AAGJ40_09780 [Planctomycetota bacterium]
MNGTLIDVSAVPDFTGRRAGKEFEDIVKKRMDDESDSQNVCIDRSGVKAAIRERRDDGTVVAQVMKSRVDFDGLLPAGRAFDFDCKVCSGASFPLNQYREDIGTKSKTNQMEYLMRRSRFRSLAGFLIHWNSRELRTKTEPAETFWFPVDQRMRFWRSFMLMDVRSINRSACRTYGYEVRWNRRGRERNYRPDVLSLLLALADDRRVR